MGALEDERYTKENCATIIKNREYTTNELKKLGFELPDSSANFIFAKHPRLSGEKVYSELKKRGILIRHFSKPRISDYNRITIGTKEQMETLINALKSILEVG